MQRARRWLSIGLIQTAAVGCSASPTQPAWDGIVRVLGVVRDFQTGGAVAGTRVTIGGVSAMTDQSGIYALSVPAGAFLSLSIDGEVHSPITLRDPTYRGDLFVHTAGCVARYGTVVDAQSRRGVSGAALTVIGPGAGPTVTTDQTGWFQFTLGCGVRRELDGAACVGFNTTLMFVTHPNYVNGSFTIGRGFCSVDRVDYELAAR